MENAGAMGVPCKRKRKGGALMNVWKRKSMRLLSMLLTFCMLLGLLTLGVSAQPAEANATVTDAILYVINSDGELEYNVVYSAPVTLFSYLFDHKLIE